MAEEPQNDGNTGTGAPGLPQRTSPLRHAISVRVIVIVLVAAAAAAGGIVIGYFVGHGQTRPVAAGPTSTGKPSASASPMSQPTTPSAPPSLPEPSVTSATSVNILMSAACKWAYPGQSSGKFSGGDYSIVCLGTGGQILGGFSGTHSLNAWCAEPQHTDGKDLPSPALVDGEWLCTA